MIDVLCKPIISGLNINKFVETGIFEAETTAQVSIWFSELHPEFGQIEKLIITGAKGLNSWNSYIPYPIFRAVSGNSQFKLYSVDNNPEFYQKARDIFSSNPNIVLGCQSSELFLSELIDKGALAEKDNCFFFLDAHWGDYWPLREEIKQVLRLPRFAVVIDDFVVPAHPDCGFDKYHGVACDWKYIKDLFEGREVSVYYPTRPNRDFRGWGLIVSGYTSEELAFLDKLPLFNGSDQLRPAAPVLRSSGLFEVVRSLLSALTGRK